MSNEAARKLLTDEMTVIVEGLGQELSEKKPDPAMLLRLTAAASMQTLTGLILLLGGEIDQKPAAEGTGKTG